jgi:hypothetical protein
MKTLKSSDHTLDHVKSSKSSSQGLQSNHFSVNSLPNVIVSNSLNSKSHSHTIQARTWSGNKAHENKSENNAKNVGSNYLAPPG